MTTYRHYRVVDETGELQPRGGVTLAIDEDRGGAAVCSDRDQYCRARGRRIAEGRMIGPASVADYDAWADRIWSTISHRPGLRLVPWPEPTPDAATPEHPFPSGPRPTLTPTLAADWEIVEWARPQRGRHDGWVDSVSVDEINMMDDTCLSFDAMGNVLGMNFMCGGYRWCVRRKAKPPIIPGMSRVDRLTDDDLEIIEDALKAGVHICDVSTSMGRVYRRKFMRALSILHGCGGLQVDQADECRRFRQLDKESPNVDHA